MITRDPSPYRKRRALTAAATSLVLLLAACSGNQIDPEECYSGTIGEKPDVSHKKHKIPTVISLETDTTIGAVNNVLLDADRGNLESDRVLAIQDDVMTTALQIKVELVKQHKGNPLDVVKGDKFSVCITDDGVVIDPTQEPVAKQS